MRIVTAAEFLRQRATNGAGEPRPDVREAVERIISSVRRGGDASLRELTRTLDGVTVRSFRVPASECAKAWAKTPEPLQRALERAARNIRTYQSKLKPKGVLRVEPSPGVSVTTEWRPLPAVACYAPGGRAPYPSTVLMMAVTAQVAGVERILLASPPTASGLPAASVLAAAHLAGVHEVYAVGGAQAVAAFAFGTDSVPAAPKIVGPGNAYVAEAKRQLFGAIGIDAIAGPTELAIWADDSVDPTHVAVDLAAQAEHDPDARTLLVVPDSAFAKAVDKEARTLVETSPRASVLRVSLLERGTIVVAPRVDDAVAVLDAYAPEHVELLGRKPEMIAKSLRNAGTIFLGAGTCAPFGDYVTGANHVLPTGRSARWASPLSVFDFMRQVVTQRVNAVGARGVGPAAIAIADAEGLAMHAEAVRRRMA